MKISFTVPGDPKPKERPRSGKYGNFYKPGKTRTYEAIVAAYYIEKYGKKSFFKDKEKIFMDIQMYHKNHSRPDPNNIARLVADALEKVAYDNDKYICQTFEYHIDKENPRLEISMMQDEHEVPATETHFPG